MFARRRQTDDFPVGVHVPGELVTLFDGKAEQFLEHPDHIFVRVIVVIPQHDMITGLAFWLFSSISLLLFLGGDVWFGGYGSCFHESTIE